MKPLCKLTQLVILISTIILMLSCETNQITGIQLDSSTKSIIIGQIDSLYAETKYSGNIIPSVQWSTSDDKVVKVSNGEIEGLKKGTAIITAQAGDRSVSCTVTVKDEINPVLTKGEIWYWGDVYSTGKSHNFTVCLADKNINMDDLSGDGEFMFLEFNTDTTFTDSIPDGIYPVSESIASGLMVAGWVDDNGSPWGTWYFGKTYNLVTSGQSILTVNKGVYNITFNFVEYYANKINGTYQGKLTYYDYTPYVNVPKLNIRKKLLFQKQNQTLFKIRHSK